MTPKLERQVTDKQALDHIQRVLSGRVWTPEDLDVIAAWVRLTGRQIKDTE